MHGLTIKVGILKGNERTVEDVLHSGSDHEHSWVYCTHKKPRSKGNRRNCPGGFNFRGAHQICSRCGEERWTEMWLDDVVKIKAERKKKLMQGLTAVCERLGHPIFSVQDIY